jgi:hypothetical protein
MTNGTVSDEDPSIIPGSLGITYDKETGQKGYPYGMQWMYPCTYSFGFCLVRTFAFITVLYLPSKLQLQHHPHLPITPTTPYTSPQLLCSD